ncbi:YD repeat-containing protein, partial [Duganella sp. CF458]
NGRGRLAMQADRSGNQLSYSYNGDLLSEVANQDGEKTVLDYANGKLASVHSVDKAGQPHTRVRYAYDGQGRLASVTVDLTPDDNSIADGKVYVTNYTYDGASQRIASIAQTDGTLLRFDYVEFNGTWRVARLRQMIDGVERVTSYDYSDLMNAVPATADVDGGKLSTIGDVTSNNSAPLDTGKASTTEPQVNNVSAGVDPGKLVTGETKVVDQHGGLNSGWLSTTESQAGPQTAIIDYSKTSNTELKDIDHTLALNGGRLSTIEAPVKDQNANIDSSKLSTKDPITAPGSANLDPSRLSTAGSQTVGHDASVDSTKLSTVGQQQNAHEVALDGSKLSTTESTLASHGDPIDGSKLSTSGTRVDAHTGNVDGGKLSTTDTQVISHGDHIVGGSLQTTEQRLQDQTASLNAGKLTTTDVPRTSTKLGLKFFRLAEDQPTLYAYMLDESKLPYHWPAEGGWARVAQDVYGASMPQAAEALHAAMGDPDYMSGDLVSGLPDTLSYQVGEYSQPYYRVVAGDTWTRIASTLYGSATPEAASMLAAVMGNIPLVVGAKLTGFPQSITITVANGSTQTTVAPYYLVKEGDTWAGIAAALYGSADPAAGAALKSAMGSPLLALNVRLTTFPASISFRAPANVTVPAYYLVPNGATWETVTKAVYGTDDAAAVAALKAALNNPALAAGAKLAGFPETLNYNTSATITVPAYYRVQAGDTWASIATSLYGVAAADADIAGAVLQAAMGNVALADADKLAGLPSQLNYETTSVITVPAYYNVGAGDSWSSIAASLYGSSAPEAVAALQQAMGNVTLGQGTKLAGLPAVLEYTTGSTITVPAYYTVQAGDTWAGLALSLYGSDDPEAASALLQAMGGAALEPGAKLTGLPATLHYTTISTITVPAYYAVQAGDTWASIAAALYGDAASVDALQAAMGNAALDAVAHLQGLPATLHYTTTVAITVAPHYTVQAGDTWASIALALYGASDAEAAAALKSAMGSPELAAGTVLQPFPAKLDYAKVTGSVDVPAYYQVQQLDTWQSVTQFLYGTSEADAIDTLRNALGYPILLPGAKLTMLPSTLVYGLSTTVPPYFLIRGGDNWNSIAGTLYGSSANEAATALKDLLGNPPLTAGTKLTNLPATITYTTHTVSVPTYYRIKEGDTWENIAQTLYRNSDPAVVAALKNVLNNPPLVAGEKLVGMPYSLDYTSDRVPPYYRIKEGDTWASVANMLYGTSVAASALQAFVAPQELVAGGKLTGLPSSLRYQVTQVVPDYYVIESGDSWDSLTLKLYGTSEPNAVQALKTRTGGSYLTPGQRLTPPASLTYQTTTQVAVPPYYTVKAGDTWQGITLALYGTDHPAAQAALEAALGKPALAAGTKLRNL